MMRAFALAINYRPIGGSKNVSLPVELIEAENVGEATIVAERRADEFWPAKAEWAIVHVMVDDKVGHPIASVERPKRELAVREVRLTVPDPRNATVRARIAEQIARLDKAEEEEAMRWIESVSEFDNDATR